MMPCTYVIYRAVLLVFGSVFLGLELEIASILLTTTCIEGTSKTSRV